MAVKALVSAAVLVIVAALCLIAAAMRAGDYSAPAWSQRRLRFAMPAALLLFIATGLLFAAAQRA